jgi:hypothetical protein
VTSGVTYLLNKRVDTHDGVHPFPAHPLVIPIFIPVRREFLLLWVLKYRYQNHCESVGQLRLRYRSMQLTQNARRRVHVDIIANQLRT